MKDFKNIFATKLDIQEKHFGKKKSLENWLQFPNNGSAQNIVLNLSNISLK